MPAATIYADLSADFGVIFRGQSFTAIAAAATEVEWTNDPFDRIIVAQSQCNPDSRLVTADRTIRSRYERALW